jgi:hypothetical protein
VGYNGSPAHAYRIALQQTLAPADAPPQDFALTFQPDAARVSRGGHAKLWVDVARTNFPADVTLVVEGLPPGVTVSSPTAVPAVTSGLLVLSAAPDAPLGTFPITVSASAPLGGQLVTRAGRPERPGLGVVRQAYLTVLDAAPFAVQPLATLPPERVQQLSGEIAALSAKVLAPGVRDRSKAGRVGEEARRPSDLGHARPGDGIVGRTGVARAAGRRVDPGRRRAQARERHVHRRRGDRPEGRRRRPARDADRPVAHERRPRPSARRQLRPQPLRAGRGPKADPAQAQPVPFARAQATFSQGGYDVAGAIDENATSGWAIYPEAGRPQTGTFFTAAPIAGHEGGTRLTFTLDQTYGSRHLLGKFRLSVSTDPKAADAPAVPAAVFAIARLAAQERTPQQRAELADYYRSIDPIAAAHRARLEALRATAGAHAEIARLEAALATQTPQLDAEQAQWEQAIAAGGAWTVLDAAELRSSGGATLEKESDGSVFVFGAPVPSDTYTVVAPTPLKNVTGVRIEALADPRLPGNGPGRSPDGNFILSGVRVAVAPAADPAAAQAGGDRRRLSHVPAGQLPRRRRARRKARDRLGRRAAPRPAGIGRLLLQVAAGDGRQRRFHRHAGARRLGHSPPQPGPVPRVADHGGARGHRRPRYVRARQHRRDPEGAGAGSQ